MTTTTIEQLQYFIPNNKVILSFKYILYNIYIIRHII